MHLAGDLIGFGWTALGAFAAWVNAAFVLAALAITAVLAVTRPRIA
jgi:hypothetical protein